MGIVGRRELLGYGVAISSLSVTGAKAAPVGKMSPPAPAHPTNLLGANQYATTICTSDLDASVRFYRDVMGFEVAGVGKINRRNSSAPGLLDGANYVLIRAKKIHPGLDRGVLRLLQVPTNAAANRPRPKALITDPGFAVIQGMTRDGDESHRILTQAGVKTISPPLYYNHFDMKPLPGAPFEADMEIKSYSAFGPAGEQMFITFGLTRDHKPWPAWQEAGLHGPQGGCDLMSTDRWPVLDFYDQILGLKPTRDTFSNQENINTLIGAPANTYYHFGPVGEGNNMELWEHRQRPPRDTVIYPTDLTRTGLAMTTFLVNDLDAVRVRVKQSAVKPLGEGALPVPDIETQDAIFLRGPVGELIEVIGR